MFHGVANQFQAQGVVSLTEKDLNERLDSVRADQHRIGAIIKDRTKLDEATIGGLFLQAKTHDSGFALGCGIVHEIREVQIPPGVPVISLVFQR
jgi:hypothetical protein